jgi:alkylation response protein AidB-like acyl-CoA dehydrogenase
MHEYKAPLTDMQFVLRELVDHELLSGLPGFEEASLELCEAVLEEADKFAGGVLSPLNRRGDEEGVRWHDTEVSTAPGWKQAYGQFVSGGWSALSCSREFGGQNLPRALSALVEEMWNGANMAFTLCPMLTRGAIEAIELNGSERQKRTYLPKMVSGEWTGTMNLTEPQAGSDLAAVRTRAEPVGGGRYKIEGQKIFITYGEHDLTENIVHMVLARTPSAPEGVRGMSLFLVPKFMVNPDGTLGERNDVRCASVEHKLGIHGSPTCVLVYGQNGGAIGELVGEENRGLEYMFVMMNAARYAVGIEGVGLSERAFQSALAFANERIQGTVAGSKDRVPIVRHPDVRRMLMLMKSKTEAMRALASVVGVSLDAARVHPDAEQRRAHQAFADLMIPVVKGWCTENSVELASVGIQVHGGMGFIEETGAAQLLRDARITPIYEGTTGIQANDLIGRKLARDGGRAAAAVIEEMRTLSGALSETSSLPGAAALYAAALDALERALRYAVANYSADMRSVSVGAVPLLELFGVVSGGWMLLRSALIAEARLGAGASAAAGASSGGVAGSGGGAALPAAFYRSKIETARFYVHHVLATAPGLAHSIVEGAAGALAEAAL